MPDLSKINKELTIIGVGIYFSYLTEIAWWVLAGLSYFLLSVFKDNKAKSNLFLFLTFALVVAGILTSGWGYLPKK